jgi:hypothetical protein
MPHFDEIPDVPPARRDGGPAPSVLATAARLKGASPTRAEVMRRRRAALALSVAWLTVQFLAFGLRGDLAKLSAGYVLGLIGAPFSAGVLAIVAAARHGPLGLGARPALLVTLALVCPLIFLVAGLAMPAPYPGGESGNLMFGAYCLNSTIAWALLPIASAAAVLRGAFAAGALWRSALLGGGCGLVAAALFTLHCPVVGKAHLLVAHGGAVLFSALLGGLVLSRFTRP